MFALALLSQSQFVELHTNWSIQRIPIAREVAAAGTLQPGIFAAHGSLVSFYRPATAWEYSCSGLCAQHRDWHPVLYHPNLCWSGALPAQPAFLAAWTKSASQSAPVPPLPEAFIPSEVTASPAWWEASKAVIFWILLVASCFFIIGIPTPAQRTPE